MAGTKQERDLGHASRHPERGRLHRLPSEHLETFLALASADPDRPGLPAFVEREQRAYLGCGLFYSGFARNRCPTCSRHLLVAVSCKGRGFCSSCGERRKAELAAHISDHVLPDVPVSQWLVSFPWRVRFLLARDPALLRAVRRIVLRVLLTWYRRRAGFQSRASAQSGAICAEQRLGSALNPNVHLHALLLDGVYSVPSPGAPTGWHAAEPPADPDVARLCRSIRDRVRRAALVADAGCRRDRSVHLLRAGKWPGHQVAACETEGRQVDGPTVRAADEEAITGSCWPP